MELLLNLLWLAMAVPAAWIWRRPRRGRQHPGRLAAALLLSCVVVLLFPTISASDDLQPMRAEVEDSSSSRRAVRQAALDHTAPLVHGPGYLWLWLGSVFDFSPTHYETGRVIIPAIFHPKPPAAGLADVRGPPRFSFS